MNIKDLHNGKAEPEVQRDETDEVSVNNISLEESDNLSEELTLEKSLDNERRKNEELSDSLLRLNAEFDNYRKRTLKEKMDLLKSGNEKLLIDILPIVDDFERAIENMSQTNNVKALEEGVDLIYTKFVNFLAQQGIKTMDVVGQPFDADKFDAITTIDVSSEDMKDKVIDCVQKGYTLNDKVIRFPKVIVGK